MKMVVMMLDDTAPFLPSFSSLLVYLLFFCLSLSWRVATVVQGNTGQKGRGKRCGSAEPDEISKCVWGSLTKWIERFGNTFKFWFFLLINLSPEDRQMRTPLLVTDCFRFKLMVWILCTLWFADGETTEVLHCKVARWERRSTNNDQLFGLLHAAAAQNLITAASRRTAVRIWILVVFSALLCLYSQFDEFIRVSVQS